MIQVKETKITVLLTIVIVIGVVGNLMNLIVFSHKALRNKSTFKYLHFLALIDIFVLLIGAGDSLTTFGFSATLRLYSAFTCKIHSFLTYFLTDMSSLVLMIVSIDRAIVVCQKSSTIGQRSSFFSNLALRFCTLFKKVEKVLVGLAVFLILINLHIIVFLTLNIVDNRESNEKKFNINETRFYKLKQFRNSSIYETGNEFENKSLFYSICYPLKYENYSYFLINIWVWIDALI